MPLAHETKKGKKEKRQQVGAGKDNHMATSSIHLFKNYLLCAKPSDIGDRTLNIIKIVPDMQKLRLVEELLRYVMDAKEV